MACETTKDITPRFIPAAYSIKGLSQNRVNVEVNDLRIDKLGSENLSEVLRAQILSALSEETPSSKGDNFAIIVDIIEHRVFYTPATWNASTRLRISLVDHTGTAIEQCDASGDSSQVNMWGYTTARTVSQESYESAVADMVSSLSSAKLDNNE